MILDHDGIEQKMIEKARDYSLDCQREMWEHPDREWNEIGRHDEVDIARYESKAGMYGLLPSKMTVDYDASGVMWHKRVRGVSCETEQGSFELRDALVTHYNWGMKNDCFRWIV